MPTRLFWAWRIRVRLDIGGTSEAALAETDQTKQNKMLIEANRYIIEERVPHVWLPTQTVYRAWWPWVKNYAGELRAGAVRPAPIYARIWIDQKLKKEMGF